jgi:hypothetical protein
LYFVQGTEYEEKEQVNSESGVQIAQRRAMEWNVAVLK